MGEEWNVSGGHQNPAPSLERNILEAGKGLVDHGLGGQHLLGEDAGNLVLAEAERPDPMRVPDPNHALEPRQKRRKRTSKKKTSFFPFSFFWAYIRTRRVANFGANIYGITPRWVVRVGMGGRLGRLDLGMYSVINSPALASIRRREGKTGGKAWNATGLHRDHGRRAIRRRGKQAARHGMPLACTGITVGGRSVKRMPAKEQNSDAAC